MKSSTPFVLLIAIFFIAPVLALTVIAHEDVGPTDDDMGPDSRDDSRAIIRNWDIVVSFEFGPTKSKLQDVIDGLKWGNNVLFDATEGQFRWKHATIWTHGKNFNDADTDIQILDTGANYRANAVKGGVDIPGGTVRLGKTIWGMKWNTTYGAMVMAHEWAHYGLYQYDEYDDVDIGGGQIVSVSWCNYTLMANSTDMDRDTEFCTPDTHNYTHSTETWDKCGWEIITQYYPGATMPNTRAEIQQDGPYIDEADQMTFEVHFPDLYIEPADITMDPPDPLEGQGVTLTAEFHNKDALLSGDVVDVRFFDGPIANGDQIDETKSLSLSGNELESISVDWVAEGGPHDIYVQLDHNNMVPELNEYDNNTAFQTFNIPSRPSISPLLGDVTVDEDEPIVLDLKQYESDIESPDEDLTWTVYAYDDTVIEGIEGENSAEDIINITPKKDYFGTTDITLMLTDGDYMSNARTLNLTWNPINDAPEVGTVTFGKDWVYRVTPVLISFDGSDAEDAQTSLTPVMEFKHVNETGWEPASPVPTYDGYLFSTLFTPDAEVELGKYDIRTKLMDQTMKSGEYDYVNDSLWIRNNPATISDYDLPSEIAYRGQSLGISIEGLDAETDSDELEVEIQYMPKGEDHWVDGGIFDDKAADYNSDSWTVPFTPSVDSARGLCDIRVRLIDPDGPGIWLYINDTVNIKNSLAVVESVTTEDGSVLRTQSIIITVKGSDHETGSEDLDMKIEYDIDSSTDWKTLDPDEYEVLYDPTNDEWLVTFTPPDDGDIGEFNIRVSFTDGDRELGEPTEIELPFDVENNLPDVSITAKAFASAGQVITFDAKGTTDVEDGTSLKYSWNFGDGGKATKSRAGHSFAREGKYTVRLTVTDRDGGETTEELTVTITGGGVGPVGSDMTLLIGAIVAVVVVVVVILVVVMKMKGIGPFA